jgi:hypothetical protein
MGKRTARPSERRTTHRKGALVLGTTILVVVALFLLLSGRARRAPAEPVGAHADNAFQPSQTHGPAGPLSANGAVASASPSGSAFEPFVSPGSYPQIPVGPAAAFQYPPGSQPLHGAVDPGTQDKEDNPVDAEKGIHAIFGPRRAIVHPPDELVIDLEVLNKLGAHLSIGNGVARFRSEKANPEKGPWYQVPFVDDGSGKDLAAGDMTYTATYKPSAQEQADLLAGGQHVFVEVVFEAPSNLGIRKYVTVMQYTREPDAKLNGKFTEAMQRGSLVVQAGVTAQQAGDYRVIASLFGAGESIAFASKTAHLEAGDGFVPLLFFGKILHDSGIDGPYELRYMMLFQHIGTGMDEIPGDTVDHAFTTKFHRAKDFSPDPYQAPPPDFPVVDQNSPSQQNKPPPLFNQSDREKLAGTSAPIRPDPPKPPGTPVPTGTK